MLDAILTSRESIESGFHFWVLCCSRRNAAGLDQITSPPIRRPLNCQRNEQGNPHEEHGQEPSKTLFHSCTFLCPLEGDSRLHRPRKAGKFDIGTRH